MPQQLVAIITPCYNESIYVLQFLSDLQKVLGGLPCRFCVVVVNDGSTDDTLELLRNYELTARNVQMDVLNLPYNVGHQQAIYQGILYAGGLPGNQFIVMDSDGEDAPAVIPRLLLHSYADIVHVVRSNRRESWLYQLAYRLYKLTFRLMTGRQMNFGNFCLINRRVLEHAAAESFAHFPAFLSRQKCSACYIAADKEERIGGRSKMGTLKLCYHAFSSFAELGIDLQRLLLTSLMIAAAVCAVGAEVCRKLAVHSITSALPCIVVIVLAGLAAGCIALIAAGGARRKGSKHSCSQNAIYELCLKKDTRELLPA